MNPYRHPALLGHIGKQYQQVGDREGGGYDTTFAIFHLQTDDAYNIGFSVHHARPICGHPQFDQPLRLLDACYLVFHLWLSNNIGEFRLIGNSLYLSNFPLGDP